MRIIAGTALVLAALAAAFRSGVAEPGTPAVVAPSSCKPSAPLVVSLAASPASSRGVARVDFAVESRIDVEDLWVELRLPAGGELLAFDAPPSGPAARGEVRQGAARVRLPAGFGVLAVEAVMLLPDPETPGAFVRQSAVASARWGEPELGLERLEVDGEVSNVVPGIHRSGR
jgi:hypothetical protein